MNATAPDERRRRAPWGALGMLGLVIAAETYFSRHEIDYTHWSNWAWRMSVKAAAKDSRDCDVICFGDSLVKYSIVPRILQEQTGKRSYNLALASSQPPGNYCLLRRALAAGARPSAIVVDYLPSLLSDKATGNRSLFVELNSVRDYLDVAFSARDPGFFADTLMRRILMSYKDRWEIREGITKALRGVYNNRREVNASLVRHWTLNRGANIEPRDPGFSGNPARIVAETAQRKAQIFPDNWSCNPVNALYIRRFMALAADRGIPVYWLLPPVMAGIQAERERNGLDGRYIRLVREMQSRFPNLIVLDARHADYGAGVFKDPIHLDRRGASILSTDVAGILARSKAGALKGPRWIDLPAFRDRPLDGPLEDSIQTVLALRALMSAGGRK